MEKSMSGESAKQDIKGSYGEGFVIMGTDRVEVSPDGKKVTAYTNDGVELKDAVASGAATREGSISEEVVPPAREDAPLKKVCLAQRDGRDGGISISADFNTVVLKGITIERAADGHLVFSAPGGTVLYKQPAPANDTAAKATLEIGRVALAGDHKGEIYGGILPSDNKPIWFSAAPKSMDHFNAASWATEQGGALPTRKQGDYLTTLRGKGGAFTEIFNRGGSFPAGYVWLAEPDTNDRYYAWCQRLSDGDQNDSSRNFELPVLSVRR